MPCYSRINSTVEFGPDTDAVLLAKAMEGLGYKVYRQGKALGFTKNDGTSGQFVNGRLTVNSDAEIDQNQFKRAYSAEVVKAAAQRFGWNAKQTSASTFQVQRRY